jgi:hypothetical protein
MRIIHGTYSGTTCGGECSSATCGFIYTSITDVHVYMLHHGGPPADGGHPSGWRTGGRADTPAGGGQAGIPAGATLRACFAPSLADADGGVMDPLVTHSAGRLGFE